MPDESWESERIREAAAGDRAALSQLLLLHYDALRAYVESQIAPPLQGLVRGEDILQQTFVRAAQGIAAFDPRHDNAFRSWLFTIAANLIRDVQKRRRRERLAGAPRFAPGGGAATPPDGQLEQLAGGHTSPSRHVQRGEAARRVQAAVAQLPQEQREVVQRRYLWGQSLDQIAAATGMSKHAIRGLCFRGRRNLRTLMGNSSLYFSSQ